MVKPSLIVMKHKTWHNNLFSNLNSLFVGSALCRIDTSNSIVLEYFNKKNKDRLCFAPFKNLFFGVDGRISSCFAQSYAVSYGKYPQTSINEAWNSIAANSIRKLSEKLYIAPSCNLCYTQVLENNFEANYANVYDQHDSDSDFPVSMEFYLDNICNLECIMCSPENSSLIAKARAIKKEKSPYNENFVNELKLYIPHLKHTHFFGGEPFLIPIYYDIWEHIIQLNHKCLIDITTNGTILNDKIKTLLAKAKFNINISIDSLQSKRFESIRTHADFKTVMENLEYYYNYCKTNNTQFFISFCPMQQNWDEIPDILEFANKHDAGLVYNRVWNPAASALWTLPPEKLGEIIEYLGKFQFSKASGIRGFNSEGFDTLRNQIKIWHKSAIEFHNSFGDHNQVNQILDIIHSELKLCYAQNKKTALSKIKNRQQFSNRIGEIHSIVEECKLSESERTIFYRNLIMQKLFFVNALFFAEDSEKIRKIINLAIA